MKNVFPIREYSIINASLLCATNVHVNIIVITMSHNSHNNMRYMLYTKYMSSYV